MTNSELASTIDEWFRNRKRSCVKLPNGWFGRPYDNLHELSLVVSTDNLTIAVVDQTQLIVIVGDVTVEISEESLAISGFDEIVWRWTEYGSERHHLERYREGVLEFVAP